MLGVALTLGPGRGNGMTLIFTRGGLGGTHMPRLGTGGMLTHGLGDGVKVIRG